MFPTGTEQTIPEWVGAEIQPGCTLQVPAAGTLTCQVSLWPRLSAGRTTGR
jgi:hypothetical protein